MLGPDPSIACRHIRAIGSEYHACSSRSSGQTRGWRSHESIFQPAGITPSVWMGTCADGRNRLKPDLRKIAPDHRLHCFMSPRWSCAAWCISRSHSPSRWC